MTRYLLASLLLVACGKSDKKPTENTKAADKAVEAPPAPKDGPDTSTWDMPKRTAAWQGTWAGDGFSLGNTAAWEIKGDDVTFVDKQGEKHYKLSIESPCTAGFSEKTKDGSSGSSPALAMPDHAKAIKRSSVAAARCSRSTARPARSGTTALAAGRRAQATAASPKVTKAKTSFATSFATTRRSSQSMAM